MENFLKRPVIYHFLRLLEAQARRNMAAEIARLGC